MLAQHKPGAEEDPVNVWRKLPADRLWPQEEWQWRPGRPGVRLSQRWCGTGLEGER